MDVKILNWPADDPLWLIVVLALIPTVVALLFAFLVQIYVAPRLERRRRVDERWEGHAIELGGILHGERVHLLGKMAAQGERRFQKRPEAESEEASRKELLAVLEQALEYSYLRIDLFNLVGRTNWLSTLLSADAGQRDMRPIVEASEAFELAYQDFERANDGIPNGTLKNSAPVLAVELELWTEKQEAFGDAGNAFAEAVASALSSDRASHRRVARPRLS